MKKLAVVASLLVLSSAVSWTVRNSQLSVLLAETARARTRLDAPGQERNPGSQSALVDSNELAQLRSMSGQLALLRGTVSSLRRSTNQSPEQLETQAAQIHASASLIREQRAAKDKSKSVRNSIGMCLMFLTAVATRTDGTVPGTWPELRSRLEQAGKNDSVLQNLKRSIESQGSSGMPLGNFEIMPVPSDVRVQLGQPTPSVSILRERESRPQPGGGFSRYYAWLDGQTEEAFSKDGNFADWEAKNIAKH